MATSAHMAPKCTRGRPLRLYWASLRMPARLMSGVCQPRNRNYTAAQIESRKFRCRILRCYDRSRCASAGSTKISASDCVMTLRKLIENTTVDSNLSWTTRWITFIAGWWRSSRRVMRMPSAIILTPRPRNTAELAAAASRISREVGTRPSLLRRDGVAKPRAIYLSRALAILLSAALLSAVPLDVPAQTVHSKKKKSNKPKPSPCRTGCTPSTSAPEITAATPEDEAAQRELSSLARSLHNAGLGAYEKLSAFAGKNA